MNMRKKLFSVIITIIILSLIIALYLQKKTYEKKLSACASIEYSKGYAQKDNTKISTPRNGAVLKGTVYSYFGSDYSNSKQDRMPLAPFLIWPPHNSEYDYLLKLTESHDYDTIYLIYIQGGKDNVKLYLPCGEYDIKIAYGSTWSEKADLFGDETQYYKCEDTFTFYREGGASYGPELTLDDFLNGTLNVKTISEDEF